MEMIEAHCAISTCCAAMGVPVVGSFGEALQYGKEQMPKAAHARGCPGSTK